MTGPHVALADGHGYAERAAYYAAEIADVPPPDLLPGLLHAGAKVAELPSGTGHFLTTYAEHDADVLLIDASRAMLDAAQAASPTAATLCRRVEDLTPGDGPVDLAVLPNAALNQLAMTFGPARLLAAAAQILAPGRSLLAQVMNVTDDGSVQRCGFYDPDAFDAEPFTDRRLRLGHRDLTRLRRQRFEHGVLQLEFELREENTILYRHAVELLPLHQVRLANAVALAGLDLVAVTPGAGGLIEVVARRPGARR
jgi:SAM-dependent methyltransferase